MIADWQRIAGSTSRCDDCDDWTQISEGTWKKVNLELDSGTDIVVGIALCDLYQYI